MKTWTRGLGAGLAALALVVTQVGCRDQEAQEQAKKTEAIISNPVTVVTTITPERKDMTDIVAVTGKFATNRVVTIGASGPGRLTSVFVREGSAVRAGQVIAVQESEDAAARLQQAVAQANAARAQLQQALRSVTATPKVSSAALAAAEAQLAQAQAQLAKAKAGARSEERNQA
jgi:multidrug efflux pump subunit AcrA (membrane-fusion protein)